MGIGTNNIIRAHLKIPQNSWLYSVDDIRDLWLDYSDLQEIFGNIIEQKDPEGYAKCMARAVIRFNSKLPRSSFNLASFPNPDLLRTLCFIEVLRVVEAYHTANFTTASSGGTVTPLHERFQALKALRQELEMDVKPIIQEEKQYMANDEVWGAYDSADMRPEYGLYGY